MSDVIASPDKLAYIKKVKSKLNDEEWQLSKYEMYLLLSLYHKSPQRVFPTHSDVDYFQDSQIKESLNTIPLEWIKELQINEDVTTLMHKLPINTASHILKVWTYFIYTFYDRCIFNIDNIIQLQSLIDNKVEKERKLVISMYYPKLIYLRGASEEFGGRVNKAVQQYLNIFKLSFFDYSNFIFGKGTQDVLYRIILLSLRKWYILKPSNFTLDNLEPISMNVDYQNWEFRHCNTILWHSLKIYFSSIINNPVYISAQHVLILKYTITLLIELDLPDENVFLSLIFNLNNNEQVLDYLCDAYLKTITGLNPFPLAPTKVLYSMNPDSNDLNMKYSTLILANRRVHDFCNLLMYRVLNTDSSKEQFIKMLQQTLTISFHSLKILRFISVAYCSLGEYTQAVQYINTYTHIAEERFNADVQGDLDDTIEDYQSVLVLASRLLLIEMDNKIDESINMANKAIQLMHEDGILKSRALQLMGMAQMQKCDLLMEQYQIAIDCLLKALEMDSTNWLICYQISLCYFKSFDLQNALIFARRAVKLNKYHVPSWHILTILLTSHKDYEAALQVCHIGFTNCVNYYFPKHVTEQRNMLDFMNDYTRPNQSSKTVINKDSIEDIDQVAAQLINLKLTETIIVEHLEGPKKGLKVCKEVLKYYKLWNDEHGSTSTVKLNIGSDDGSSEHQQEQQDTSEMPSLQKSASRSSIHSSLSASSIIPKPIFTHISDRDVMKNKKLKFALETAISRARTVSRRAKNLKNLRPTKKEKKKTSDAAVSEISKSKKSQRQQHVLITIWSRIVKLLIQSGQIVDARDSVMELQTIDSLNVDVWIGEALVLMAENRHREAINILESISMENQPIELLLTLAQGYFHLNSLNMAEHVIYTIMNHFDCQFTSEPWWIMGKIAEKRNELENAIEMYEKAAYIEEHEPVRLPSILPRWI